MLKVRSSNPKRPRPLASTDLNATTRALYGPLSGADGRLLDPHADKIDREKQAANVVE